MYTLLPIRIFMIFELAFFSLVCQEFLDDIAPYPFLKTMLRASILCMDIYKDSCLY